MKIKNYLLTRMNVSVILLASIVFVSCSSYHKENIVIENDYFKYEVTRDGKNLHFIDKTTGKDYLDPKTDSKCASIEVGGEKLGITALSKKGENLQMEFGRPEVSATVQILIEKDRIKFEVLSTSEAIDSFTFLNIPLIMEGNPNEAFAACALSMNLFTHVLQLPALQTHLWATCYKRFGLSGAKVILLGVPMKDILPKIRETMQGSKEIPHSTAGGAWAQMSKEGYGSYLMNFGTLTEKTVDEWIKMCRSLGFNQIDSHGGGAFFRFGDFELNPEKWPEGWENFRRINKRLHDAGISSIFHTYAFFIEKKSRYVTPVPSPDLAYFKAFTLAEPITPESTEIAVNESTAGMSTITGWRVENSVTLRIGKELVTFNGITDSPPYKFTSCKRGAYGTVASAHTTNENAYQLKELFGLFLPGPETELFREIGRRTAEIVNQCNFDGIYLDAIDASHILAGPENFWYYGTKFIFEIAKHLDHPAGMEMSAMSHHWWHYRSRWQAWDRPIRGYKRFEDIHAASLKTDEYEHGRWKGNTPLIQKYSTLENGGLLLPLHLGWWGHQTWDPPQKEPTFNDDVEYLCCKMIGNNAGLSMLGGADEITLNDNPIFRRLNAIIRQYEELRHKNYFNDTIRALLRQPGKEFTLFREADSSWNFKPVAYQKHKVEGINHPTARWIVNNEFSKQPVKLRIEPLMSVKSFDNLENIVVADFSKPGEFIVKEAAPGISGTIGSKGEKSPDGGACGIFNALSEGISPRDASWINLEKKIVPPLDLEKNQGLGVWIKGDGSNQLLSLRILSPEHLITPGKGDHFIKIDFTGWKYFELVEFESSAFSDYLWPGLSSLFNDLYVYQTYRCPVVFKSIDKLQLWYNNLPSGKEVSCVVGPVKAIPMVSGIMENPSITIGGEKIVFPVKMESGMYLEFRSKTDCKLYGSKGELIKEIIINGIIPELAKGDNEISFSCDGTKEINTRVQVTVISEGDPLVNK